MSAVEKGAVDAPIYKEPKNGNGLHLSTLFGRGKVMTFQGKTNFYPIEIYRSGNQTPFTRMPEYSGLIDVTTDLYLGIYPTRKRGISIDRMRRSLSHPRTILMLARDGDTPVGFGIFPRLLFGGDSVLYSSRGFLPDHEGQGLGTHFLDTAIQLHQQESYRFIRYGVLMTQNWLSVVTLRKLQRSGMIGKILPFDERYDKKEDDKYVNREAQYTVLGVHREVYLNSLGINTGTGVSKGELVELGMNEASRPSREDTEAWKIHQQMVSPPYEPYNGLDMNREGGDVVYVTFELKKSNGGSSVVQEAPLDEVA